MLKRFSSLSLSKSLPLVEINHGIWLRDHCKCPACFHAVTRQRLLDTSMIPLDIAPARMSVSGETVTFDWPDGHVSQFDLAWLKQNAYLPRIQEPCIPAPKQVFQQNNTSRKVFWGSHLAHQLPRVGFREVMESRDDQGLAQWLQHLDTFGIGFVQGVPITPEDTQKLAQRIAFIRETHYGGFWDFTSNLAHGDTAYTTLALPAHTDTTYFTDPVGLQGFHLLSHINGSGGKSLFVDGFQVARVLLERHPWAFDILSKTRLQAHSAGDASILYKPFPPSGHPILNLDPQTRELYQIRFNNDDRSPLQTQDPLSFYAALREWTLLLKSQDHELWLQLQPGTFVLFNNWRVLHGRSSFSGQRRMVGCYIGMDDFASRVRMLVHAGKEKMLL